MSARLTNAITGLALFGTAGEVTYETYLVETEDGCPPGECIGVASGRFVR